MKEKRGLGARGRTGRLAPAREYPACLSEEQRWAPQNGHAPWAGLGCCPMHGEECMQPPDSSLWVIVVLLFVLGTEGKVFISVLEAWLLQAWQGWVHASIPAGAPGEREVDYKALWILPKVT